MFVRNTGCPAPNLRGLTTMENRMIASLHANDCENDSDNAVSISVRLFSDPGSLPVEGHEQIAQALVGLLEVHRCSP